MCQVRSSAPKDTFIFHQKKKKEKFAQLKRRNLKKKPKWSVWAKRLRLERRWRDPCKWEVPLNSIIFVRYVWVKFTRVQTIAKRRKKGKKTKGPNWVKMNGFLSCPKSGSKKCTEEEGTSGEGRKRGFRALLLFSFFFFGPSRQERKKTKGVPKWINVHLTLYIHTHTWVYINIYWTLCVVDDRPKSLTGQRSLNMRENEKKKKKKKKTQKPSKKWIAPQEVFFRLLPPLAGMWARPTFAMIEIHRERIGRNMQTGRQR